MRIGLVSYRCENRNIVFNMSQIELAMKRSEGKVDLSKQAEAMGINLNSSCYVETVCCLYQQKKDFISVPYEPRKRFNRGR